MTTSARHNFLFFAEGFFGRYSAAELERDLAQAGESISQEIATAARGYFVGQCAGRKASEAHKEAVLSVRFAGISTRTIRNWKAGGSIYSERSSQIINSYFDRHIPAHIRIDRRRLAWLWVACRLKLDNEQTDEFLRDCMGGQQAYALNLYEIVLRSEILVGSVEAAPQAAPQAASDWDFFEALEFVCELNEQIRADQHGSELYRQRILEVLDGHLRAPSVIADRLSCIYEDILGEMGQVSFGSRDTQSITRLAKEAWRQDFPVADIPGKGRVAVAEIQQQLSQWAWSHRELFGMAYLAWVLTVLDGLIGYATGLRRLGVSEDLFAAWYFDFSCALQAADPSAHAASSSFPADLAAMADRYEYEEGERFVDFAHRKCRIYFDRMLDVPQRITRQRLIEYCAVCGRGRLDEARMSILLTRHQFQPLNKGEQASISEKLFRFPY